MPISSPLPEQKKKSELRDSKKKSVPPPEVKFVLTAAPKLAVGERFTSSTYNCITINIVGFIQNILKMIHIKNQQNF